MQSPELSGEAPARRRARIGGRCEPVAPPRQLSRHLRAVPPHAGPPDPRVVAALAVLGGEEIADVAERLGLPLSTVLRHTETFRAAGIAAVTGVEPADEEAADRYLGVLAHEMRAPLTAAAGWVELLGTDGLDDEEQEPARQLVLNRLAQARRLCDDLLDATALRLGRLRLRRRVVDLARLVADAVQACADDRVVLLAEQGTLVFGDPHRLDQVVTNLLSNALRYGAPGPVQARVRRLESAVEFAVVNAGSLGPGVCAERVFDAYEATGVGHGLGLYVSREIVVAHGGRIEVRCNGELTEFVCLLPVESQPPGALDVPAMR